MQGHQKQQTIRMLIGGTIATAAIVAFLLWRSSVIPVAPGYAGILVDQSDSRKKVCDQVGTIAEVLMQDPRMGRGSTITLFSTGDSESANEPIHRGSFTLPDTRGTMGGPEDAVIKRKEFVDGLTARCIEIPETNASPLFQGMMRVVEFLKEQDKRPNAHLTLYTLTDGEETEIKEIKQAFNQKPGSPVILPSVIENDRVTVQICGIAQTIGTVIDTNGTPQTKTRIRTPLRADREGEVWIHAFSQKEMVRISPFCVSHS